jgi:hypothetical protein
MTQPPAQPQLSDTPTGYQIRTDRPCARCGFNLFGQTVFREHRYGLIAARCPECGQLAALQEYPALGRWADRWAKTLAALWVLVLLGAMGAQFGPTFGLMFGGMEMAFEDAGEEISLRFIEWQRSQGVEDPTAGGGISPFRGSWSPISDAWWTTQRASDPLATGRTDWILHRDRFAFWFPLAAVSFTFGAFWSTATLGTRRWGAFLLPLIPIALAASYVWMLSLPEPNVPGTITARDAAADVLRVPLFVGGLIAVGAGLVPGVLTGRKIARLIVRLALPPRMRTALSILWLSDGLPPPGASRTTAGEP